jgi:hypothetical protein
MIFGNDHGDGFIAMPLPVVEGSVDFQSYKLLLQKVDQLLKQSGIESRLENIAVDEAVKSAEEGSMVNSTHFRRYASFALRCTIARFLSQESYRSFSVHLADSILLRDFCGYSSPYAPKSTPSKSTLQRFEGAFSTDTIREVADLLFVAASDEKSDLFNLDDGLFMGIDTDFLFLDSTCAKIDIHFPVDWVLLKDSVKSIIQSIIQIRSHGIKHRMEDPKNILSNVNKIAIQMTNASSGRGSKKEKKTVFRKLRKLLLKVSAHGERYLKKLKEGRESTDLSEAQAAQIERKLSHVLGLVPKVIDQAYERIIGERQVANEDKILSIHEEHAKVYNRGKAGAQVEFGLQLLIGENLDGMITHWQLFKESPKPDHKHTDDVLERINDLPESCRPHQLVGDRGFYSKRSEKKISQEDLVSNMCPLDPKELAERLSCEKFKEVTQRRAQTEARIGILKNNFMGKKLRVHGFAAQERHVAWAVLTHNLWVLARFPFHDLMREDAA